MPYDQPEFPGFGSLRSLSDDEIREPGKLDKVKGWTGWQRFSKVIWELHGPTRELHWPKRNFTEHFNTAGELVGESKWGVHGNWWRARKLRRGEEPYKPDPEEMRRKMDEAFAAFQERKRQEREKAARRAALAEKLAAAALPREKAPGRRARGR
jgi:hypothetical protein